MALRLSRTAVDAIIDGKDVKLVLDLKTALTPEMLKERIDREMAELEPTEQFSELLWKLVPKPLIIPICEEIGLHSRIYVSKITEKNISDLIQLLKNYTFQITDYAPFTQAIVTAGGVSCDEVNPETMESKIIKNLYFAGEILDLDADTGGYNLQIAFSTGKLAGMLKK
ncbi:MAG: NAD(P)/FAD-dependent oxidoreductase [Rikenellaceae bacterium]